MLSRLGLVVFNDTYRNLPVGYSRFLKSWILLDSSRYSSQKVGGSNGATRLRYHEDLFVLSDPFLILNDCDVYTYNMARVISATDIAFNIKNAIIKYLWIYYINKFK